MAVEFLIYDDESDEKTAARLYEKLITEDKVDLILGPYGTAITEAVADIPDKAGMESADMSWCLAPRETPARSY